MLDSHWQALKAKIQAAKNGTIEEHLEKIRKEKEEQERLKQQEQEQLALR